MNCTCANCKNGNCECVSGGKQCQCASGSCDRVCPQCQDHCMNADGSCCCGRVADVPKTGPEGAKV